MNDTSIQQKERKIVPLKSYPYGWLHVFLRTQPSPFSFFFGTHRIYFLLLVHAQERVTQKFREENKKKSSYLGVKPATPDESGIFFMKTCAPPDKK